MRRTVNAIEESSETFIEFIPCTFLNYSVFLNEVRTDSVMPGKVLTGLQCFLMGNFAWTSPLLTKSALSNQVEIGQLRAFAWSNYERPSLILSHREISYVLACRLQQPVFEERLPALHLRLTSVLHLLLLSISLGYVFFLLTHGVSHLTRVLHCQRENQQDRNNCLQKSHRHPIPLLRGLPLRSHSLPLQFQAGKV